MESRIIDLNALVAGIETMLRRMIGEDVTLTFLPAAEALLVEVDPGQLEQVLVNLGLNSRDAMPQGGTLKLSTSHVDLDEASARMHPDSQPGDHAVITVSDSGAGVAPENLEHIFEPFFTTKEVGRGTGLGLAMVHGIVRQSRGFLAVSSEVGQGTTFRVFLPRAQGKESVAPKPLPAGPARGSETILFVEDDAVVLRVGVEILTQCGYRVLSAGGGEEAIRASEGFAEPIDLLVTDMVMPGLNGRALANRLAISRPNMRVLFVSGYTDDAILRHGGLAPDVAFLQKPFSMSTLAGKVRQVLDASPTG